MGFRYRDHAGKYCSVEVYKQEVREGLIEPGENMESEMETLGNMGLTEEELATMPQSALEKMRAYMSAMLSGPIMSTLVSVNRDSAVLATRNRVGGIINTQIREKILRNVIPPNLHPVLLDNPLAASLVDLAVSNAAMGLFIMFGDKLPGKVGEYGLVLGRCSATAAYSGFWGSVEFENLVGKFLNKDLLDLLSEAQKSGA